MMVGTIRVIDDNDIILSRNVIIETTRLLARQKECRQFFIEKNERFPFFEEALLWCIFSNVK